MANEDGSEVLEGKLECQGCRRSYAITRGVPRMVVSDVSATADIKTGETFGHAWRAFPRIDQRYRQQFLDWINPVYAEFFSGKMVLDCGCGKGRHIDVVSQFNPKAIFAVDIGDAIDVAYQNCGHLPNVHIVQGDVANLPFAPVMDMAFSFGVLDHMDSPAAGVKSMIERLNDDGSISIWVYGRENNGWIITFINPFRLAVTSKLPGSVLKIVSGLMATPVFFFSKLIARPWKRLQQSMPFLPDVFYQDYMAYISRFDFTEIHHITHDHLVAPVASYSTKEEVRSWFEKAGLADPLLRWHNKNSWAAFASKNARIKEEMVARAESVKKIPQSFAAH
ncbi:MAG TPA: methyltransferase domain-containing protein [Chroococcales cyanobacterium]